MHYQTITAKALDLRLIKSESQSPEATMNAQISIDIDRQQKRGGMSRFIRNSRGHIALSGWELGGLADQIRKHNEKARKDLQARLLGMHLKDFEPLIATLLSSLGFEDASVTDYHHNGGIDVRGTLVVGGSIDIRTAVQVKRYKQNVQRSTVQQVRGSLGAHERGLIITTSAFGSGAIEEARRVDSNPVALMDGAQLVGLLVEHGIGVRRTS